MRRFQDRDFLQTQEGFFFCVVGGVHPQDRVISYIKYLPSDSGVWGNKKQQFNRILKNYTISNLLETFQYLEKNQPQYLFKSPVDNITVTAVPVDYIKQQFMPEKKLAELRNGVGLDSLQQKLLRFIKYLHQISGIKETAFGITGSLLLDIHQPSFSDLDVIVYGVENSWKLKQALINQQGLKSPIKRLDGNALDDWCLKKSQHYPMTKQDAFNLYKRKWNLGYFEDRWVSIHPVKTENEITEKYGEKTYEPICQVTIEATVSDSINSLFLPTVYIVKDVTFLENEVSANICEVVTYEGLYSSLAENGEKIHVKGKLEKVTQKQTNKKYYRIVVGSPEGKGTECIKNME
jgi:predicted nucleotidyltransferase